MRINLHRKIAGKHATLGDLYVNGEYVCHTLEDVVRPLGPKGEGKIMGETAIPAGIYKIIINLSQRFKKLMPRLLEVPNFTGILIHKGNTDVDTHGCILVGMELDVRNECIKAGSSTPAWNALWPMLEAAFNAGEEIWIEVQDDF